MNDSVNLIVPAQIFGCMFLAALTSFIPLEITSRLDKSERSTADKFAEDMVKVIMPAAMILFSGIAVAFALEAGTTLAIVLAFAFSTLVGPAFLYGVSAMQRLCDKACRLIEERAAKHAV